MGKQPHWFDQSYAGDFFGDLLDAVIKITETTKKTEPPKPKPLRDQKQK